MAELVGSDTTRFDAFGASVAVDGDRAVVGAPDADSNFGSAYVFVKEGNEWLQESELTPSNSGFSNILFGTSVAIDGDVAVVGAPRDFESGVPNISRTGSAFVFTRTKTGWIEEAKLLPLDAADGNRFGESVAIDGERILIGARFADAADIESGAAYVFRKTESGWIQEARLFPVDGYVNDWFGLRLTLSDPVAVITAWNNEHDGPTHGSAYVYRRGAQGWTQEAKLTASQGLPREHFGASVATDGVVTIIGVWQDSTQDVVPGSAYVFRRTEIGWVEEARLGPFDGVPGTAFGGSVAYTEDYVIVGAYFDSELAYRSGAIYAYVRDGSEWRGLAKIHSPAPVDNSWFGTAVSMSPLGALVGALKENRAYAYGIFDRPDCNINGLNDVCECEQPYGATKPGSLSTFALFQACFSGPNAGMSDVCCQPVDKNGDCDVDLDDYQDIMGP